MVDYRLIMKLSLQGRSYRQIQQQCGAAHATIAKARKALDSHGITSVSALADVSDAAIAELVGDGRVVAPGEFVQIDFAVVIKARSGRNKTSLRVLWSNYLNQTAVPGQRFYSYERFRQLVSAHVSTLGVTALITHQPGHTMQVDWAGSTMAIYDPVSEKTSKIHIFVASLPYSGMLFAHGFVDEKQPSWIEGHRLGFEYFGGVPDVVVPDNASTASNQIVKGDRARKVNATYEVFLEHYDTAALPTNPVRPREKGNVESAVKVVTYWVINPKYEEFLEHYDTAALPTNPVRPREKGNVESAVKVITNWVINKLAASTFVSLDDLNEAIGRQVDAINDRVPFRNQQQSRRMLFEQYEAKELGGLPETAWVDTVWKKSKVTPDWHITINTVKYSVPYHLVGQTVDVRIRGQILDVFASGSMQASHQVSHQRGAYVTNIEHCPPGMTQATNLWTPDYFLAMASRVGPYTRQAIASLLASRQITAQAFQPARNIIAMGKSPENRLILEQACARLLGQTGAAPKAISYTAVKHAMAVLRHEQSTRPTQPPQQRQAVSHDDYRAPETRPQTRGMLGGRDQFSLSELMKDGENE